LTLDKVMSGDWTSSKVRHGKVGLGTVRLGKIR